MTKRADFETCNCSHIYDSESTHCDGCHRTWTSYAECHCRGCCRHFGSVKVFDAHFRGDKCQDPPAISSKANPTKWVLVERRSGQVWSTKMDEKALDRLTRNGKRASRAQKVGL